MNQPLSPSSTTPSSVHANRKRRLIRAGLLAAAIAVGAGSFALLIAPVASAVDAQSGTDGHSSFLAMMHGGHSHADMHAHFDKVMTDAGVDAAQKQRIHAAMKTAMTDEHADMQRFHDNLSQLTTLLSAASIDNAAIAKVRGEQDRLMLATSHRLSDTMVAVARDLTADQRAKLHAEIDQMMAAHAMPVQGD